MAVTTAVLQAGVLAVSAVTTTALGVYAWRHREEPGALPFVGMVAVCTVWSGTKAVGFLTFDPTLRLLIYRVGWSGVATVGVWPFLFAVTYTGYDDFVTRRTVALLFVIPAVVVAGIWTNPWLHLVWRDVSIVVVDGIALIRPPPGPLFWVSISYSYGLIAVASALLVRLVYTSDYLYADQSALLLVGIALPVVFSLVYVSGSLTAPAIDYTPHAFTVTGLTFGWALYRRQLFDLVPATRTLGRNAAISQLDAGVVIVDNAHRIVYCNAAAGEILGCEPADALGRDTQVLVDESRLDFDAQDALAEIERDGRTYEIRTSPITDRRDRRIGNTLVIHDITARTERERRLAAQRDELETVNDLNAVLREVNQALVSAATRAEIERRVCERMADADLYRTACVADVATWTGDADRWTVAGTGVDDPAPPDVPDDGGLDDESLRESGRDDAAPATRPGDAQSRTLATFPGADDDRGTWLVVPLVYGRTVYGALGLYTDRETVSDREQAVLGELGETVGHAIDAVGKRQLLSAEAVVELELESTDADAPLVAAAAEAAAEFTLAGFVPGSGDGQIAYVRVAGEDPQAGGEALDAVATGDVRQVRGGDGDALFEWQVTGDALLGALVDHGANVRNGTAADGRAVIECEVASDDIARTLVDHLESAFPDTRVLAKRERSRPAERDDAIAAERLDDLTDRQREVMEAAYRAGYFNWPRDSTAEEVAESLDISSPTLHSHLRKAEETLLADLFDADAPIDRQDV